jgi:hypothetical protein
MLPTSMRGSTWPARLSFAAASLFTLASGGTNLIYGWSKGTDTASSLVWAAVSVGVSIIFALSWPAFILSLDRKQWARAAMVLVALVVTGTYSVSAAVGSAMGGRLNAANVERDTTDARKKAQASYDGAKAELDTLKPARTVGELEAVIAKQSRQGCKADNRTGNAWVCPVPTSLLSELAKAKRRAELEARLEKASADLEHMRPAKVANSDAIALAAYLNRLGFSGVNAEWLNELLVLLAVLVIECGGGLALAVGMALSEGAAKPLMPKVAVARSGQSERADSPGERSGTNEANEQSSVHSERQGENLSRINGFDRSPILTERPERSAHERVLSALRSKDGVLFGSQGSLGASFGWSKTRMNEVLHELQAIGRVRLAVSRQGTMVRLVAMP